MNYKGLLEQAERLAKREDTIDRIIGYMLFHNRVLYLIIILGIIWENIRKESIYFKEGFYSNSYKEKIIKNGNISSLLNNLGSCYPSNEYYFFSLISYIKSIRSIYI